jgi:hypothetical protein
VYPLPDAAVSDTNKSEPQGAGNRESVSLVDQRVAVIVGLKMRLKWKRLSARRLAAEWGVSEQYVHDLSCEANKVVRRSATDPDAIAADLLPDLLATYQAASRSVRDRGGDPHAQAKMAASAANLAKILVDVAGLDAPKVTKTEITGKDGGALQIQQSSANLSDMTDGQLERLARGEPLAAVLASGGTAGTEKA